MRRKEIIASLADRGVPEIWASHAESAALSHMSPDRFKAWLASDDARGFPPPDAANCCRLVNLILDFWQKRSQSDVSEDELENWHADAA